MLGAFMVLGVAIENLTSEKAIFVFVGIAILGLMMQGWADAREER